MNIPLRSSLSDKQSLRYRLDQREMHLSEAIMDELDLGTPNDVRMFPASALDASGLRSSSSRNIPIAPRMPTNSDMVHDQGEKLAEYHEYVMYQRIAGAMLDRNTSCNTISPGSLSVRCTVQDTVKPSLNGVNDSLQQLVIMGLIPPGVTNNQSHQLNGMNYFTSNRDGFSMVPRLGWQLDGLVGGGTPHFVPVEDDYIPEDEGVFEMDL